MCITRGYPGETAVGSLTRQHVRYVGLLALCGAYDEKGDARNGGMKNKTKFSC